MCCYCDLKCQCEHPDYLCQLGYLLNFLAGLITMHLSSAKKKHIKKNQTFLSEQVSIRPTCVPCAGSQSKPAGLHCVMQWL